MREIRSVTAQYDNATLGDAAVEGLFSGMIAGISMAAYLGMVNLMMGESLLETFARFAVSDDATPLLGFLLHLGVSGVYGLVYGLLCRLIARRWISYPFLRLSVLMGCAYGLVLLILAQVVLLPGSASPLKEISLTHLLIAHLIYGAALGILTRTEENSLH
ncbi:MAG TPA: hypothetical protein VFZ76_16030 [Anaerolineales bacterium]